MAHTYHIDTTVMDRGDAEIVARIAYTYTPGTRATWTDPGDPPEVEIQKVTLQRVISRQGVAAFVDNLGEAPAWMVDALRDDEGVYDAMIDNAHDDYGPED